MDQIFLNSNVEDIYNDFETILETSTRFRHINRLKHKKDKRAAKKICNSGYIKIHKIISFDY